MPVPATMADLTTSEATNSPPDSETVTATTRPSDYLRAHAAILKTHSEATAEHGATGAIVGTTNTQTLTNKTVDLASNTLTGTTAQFNTALSDGDFATLAGTETLTNKTISGGAISDATLTLKHSTTAAPIAEGVIEWKSDDNLLKIGTGDATKTFTSDDGAATITSKTFSTGCTWGGNAVPVANGGTGATTAAAALTNLGALSTTGKAADSNLLDGFNADAADTGSTVALRDASGDLTARLFRSSYGVDGSTPASTAEVMIRRSSTDNYLRPYTRGAFLAYIGTGSSSNVGLLELATTTEASTGTDTARAVTPAGVEAHMNANALAWGQTYQDMTASRALSTTYTNSTGRPICVSVKSTLAAASTYTATVAGALVYEDSNGGSSSENRGMFFIVPSGSTYSVAGGTLQAWKELR